MFRLYFGHIQGHKGMLESVPPRIGQKAGKHPGQSITTLFKIWYDTLTEQHFYSQLVVHV